MYCNTLYIDTGMYLCSTVYLGGHAGTYAYPVPGTGIRIAYTDGTPSGVSENMYRRSA
jgi:hypothetical protein